MLKGVQMDYKQYFKQYKTNRSLLSLKNIEKQQILREILDSQDVGIAAQIISDMPSIHSTESVVERLAVRREEQQLELNVRLKLIENDMFSLQCSCNQAEAYLSVLGSEERFVVEQYYLEELSFPQVADAYQCHYKERREIRALQYLQESALKKINGLLKG